MSETETKEVVSHDSNEKQSITYILLDSIEQLNQLFIVSTNGDKIGIIHDHTVYNKKIDDLDELINYINEYYDIKAFGNLCRLYPALTEFGNKLIDHKKNNDDNQFFIIKLYYDDIQSNIRKVTMPDYKYAFNTVTGMFARWGKTFKDNPKIAPLGPEIADIEISTVCNGNCKFCYKANKAEGNNMSIDVYKKVIDILNQNNTLSQVALGVGDIAANKDLEEILTYSRENRIVPNITISSNDETVDEEYTDLLAKYCGAVSISNYDYKNTKKKIYDLYYHLNKNKDYMLNTINIHQLISKETYDRAKEMLIDFGTDSLYNQLVSSIIFLTLKKTNAGSEEYSMISKDEYIDLINIARKYNIQLGFDSCGCHNFFVALKNDPNYNFYKGYAESCESSIFSIYVDVNGNFYPCSFIASSDKIIKEDVPNVNNIKDLMSDIWYSKFMQNYRDKIINNVDSDTDCIKCPFFNTNFR